MEEIRKLADTAAAQIAAYPAITGKDKLKRMMKRGLLRQKLAPADAFSWPNALLGEGLLAAFETTGEKKYLQAVADYLKRWKSTDYRIHYVDNIMNGWLALWIEAYLESPDGRRYYGEREIEELTRLCGSAQKACASWLKAAPKTGQGIFPYRAQHPDWLFADTTGMICPFLCRYGKVHKNEEMLRLGTGQLLLFLRRGMDEAGGLPYHGYEESNGMKQGIIGWGRACGWLMKGLAESLPWIPQESGEYRELETAFRRLTVAICRYQRNDGGFSWQMEARDGHRDTSAEGMIGAALICGTGRAGKERSGDGQEAKPAQMAEIRRRECAARLKQAVGGSISEATVGDCSGECKGFGEYPQVYGSYPWGTGSVLSFLAGMERLR